MSIGLALGAALCWGAGDFLGGLASRRAALLTVLVVSQAAGLAGIVAAAAILGGTPRAADLGVGVLAGLAGGAGIALLYRGLASGAMALVAPVTGVVAAVLPAIAGIALGERPGGRQLMAVAIAIAAVAMLSGGGHVSARMSLRAVALAVLAGAAFGAFYIVISRAAPAAGLWPLVAARAATVLGFGGAAIGSGRPLVVARRVLPAVLACGLLDVAANALYLGAVHGGLLSIVAVVASLYPGSTILCGLLFLGERLRALQTAGVALALAAVVLITTG